MALIIFSGVASMGQGGRSTLLDRGKNDKKSGKVEKNQAKIGENGPIFKKSKKQKQKTKKKKKKERGELKRFLQTSPTDM